VTTRNMAINSNIVEIGLREQSVLNGLNNPLRQWQQEALDAWNSKNNIGVIEAVTGSGKSLVGILAAARALDHGMAVVIIVPKKVLQEQWIKELRKHFPEYGIVGGIGGEYGNIDHWRSTRPQTGRIVVSVVNTFANNEHLHPKENVNTLIIADEVHNYSGPHFRKVLNSNFKWRLGLTATLEPQDGRYFVFSRYFGNDPVYTYDYRQALDDKCVSAYSVLLIRVELDADKLANYQQWSSYAKYYRERIIERTGITFEHSKVHREISELREQGLMRTEVNAWEEAMNAIDTILIETESKALAIKQVSKFVAERGNTIAFSDSVRLANQTQNILAESGISSAIIKAGVPNFQRQIYFDQLKVKRIKALISPRALDEGINLEHLSVGLFIGVRRQRLQLIQRLGRVLRIEANKEKPLIIIPVNRNTWEDPYVSGNERLINSSLNLIVENADTVHVADVADSELIEGVLERYEPVSAGIQSNLESQRAA
jgi:RNA polymerase primary sigma factor